MRQYDQVDLKRAERILMTGKEREVWAVDIDDVCLDYGGGFSRFNNRVGWTRNMKPHHYIESWGELWDTDDIDEITRRTATMNRGMNPFLRPVKDSQVALAALAKTRDLVILTSRPRDIHNITKATIDRHFPDTFRDLKYLEGGWGDRGATQVTKGETAIELGASTLIDDQPRHVIGMAMAGGVGLLFGNSQLAAGTTYQEAGVIKVPSWKDVLEHAGIDTKSIFSEGQ